MIRSISLYSSFLYFFPFEINVSDIYCRALPRVRHFLCEKPAQAARSHYIVLTDCLKFIFIQCHWIAVKFVVPGTDESSESFTELWVETCLHSNGKASDKSLGTRKELI